MDNGAKRALIPIENKRQFLEVSADVLEPLIRSSTGICGRRRLRRWGYELRDDKLLDQNLAEGAQPAATREVVWVTLSASS